MIIRSILVVLKMTNSPGGTLQPDINKFAGDVMPILLVQLTQMAQQMGQLGKNVPNLSKTFYALETFCENLGRPGFVTFGVRTTCSGTEDRRRDPDDVLQRKD